jgi:hypothetical protein
MLQEVKDRAGVDYHVPWTAPWRTDAPDASKSYKLLAQVGQRKLSDHLIKYATARP